MTAGAGCRNPRRRVRRTTDEIATAPADLLGRDAVFITGSDLLIDGGVIAAIHAERIQIGVG